MKLSIQYDTIMKEKKKMLESIKLIELLYIFNFCV